MHRFFAPAFDPGDEIVTLPSDEGEHLTRVLRLGVGDTVSVFDGRGNEFLARVVSATRRDVRAQLLSRVDPPEEPAVRLTLAQAVLKGDKMDDVIRDAVMLGVSAIQPIVTRRTEVTVAALMRGAGGALAARGPGVGQAVAPRRAARDPDAAHASRTRWTSRPAVHVMLVEPGTDATESIAALRREPMPSDAVLWIGPEGGWDEQERVQPAPEAHG